MRKKVIALLFFAVSLGFAQINIPPGAGAGQGNVNAGGNLTNNKPVIGQGAQNITVGSTSGNTTTFATTNGALTNGNCASFDASGNVVDSGGACSGGANNVTAAGTLTTSLPVIGQGAKTTAVGSVTGNTTKFVTAGSGTFTLGDLWSIDASGNAIDAAVTAANVATAASNLTNNLPVIGNGSKGLSVGSATGNTTKFVTSTGSLTTGDCAKWDASGNLIDSGQGCGTSPTVCTATPSAGSVTYNDTGSCTAFQVGTLTANITSATATNFRSGQRYNFLVTQGGSAYTVVWPASFSGFPQLLPATGATYNLFGFYDGTNVRLNGTNAGYGFNPDGSVPGANPASGSYTYNDPTAHLPSALLPSGNTAVMVRTDAGAQAASNNFVTGYKSDGTPNAAQPAFSNISGVCTIAQGCTGTGSTLTGLVRGNSSAMTAAELSGDVVTSGSNAATVKSIHDTLTTITNVASPYSVVTSDSVIICDATSGAVTINLPSATGTGREITVIKKDSSGNACTITRAGSDTIDGATTLALNVQYVGDKIIDSASTVWYRSHVLLMAGDVTGASSASTVSKINGTSVNTNSAADQTIVTTASATASWTSIPNCGSSSQALAYSTSTHTFSCQSITGSAAAGGSNTQLQYNNATALGGISGFTTNGTTTITGGASSILDLSAGATFKAPSVAGGTSSADGSIVYDSTAKITHVRTNGADSTVAATTSTSTTTTNVLHATAVAGVYTPSAIGVADLPPYGTGGGTAQAQTATMATAPGSLTTGLTACWLPSNNNSGAGPTLAVNGLTAKTITKLGTASLSANDITTTAVACAIYDGTQWELQNPQTSPAAAAGGSNTQLQFNNSSALGGISGFTTNGTTTITGGANSIFDLSAGATFKVPVVAGATAGADGQVAYDSTNKITHVRTNAADSLVVVTTSTDTTTTHLLHATATGGVYSSSALTTSDMAPILDSTAAAATTPLAASTNGSTATAAKRDHTHQSPGGIAAITSNTSAIVNTETSIVTAQLPANFLAAGTTIQGFIQGTCTTSTSPGASNIRIRLGTSGTASSNTSVLAISFTPAASQSTKGFTGTVMFTTRTTGGTGTVLGNGYLACDTSLNATACGPPSGNSATATIDTTAINNIDITYQSGAASSSCTFYNAYWTVIKM